MIVPAILFEERIEVRPPQVTVVTGQSFLVEVLMVRHPEGRILERLDKQTVWSIPDTSQGARVYGPGGPGVFRTLPGSDGQTELTAKIGGKEILVPVSMGPHPRFSEVRFLPEFRLAPVGRSSENFKAFGHLIAGGWEDITADARWLSSAVADLDPGVTYDGKSIRCDSYFAPSKGQAMAPGFAQGFSGYTGVVCTDKKIQSISIPGMPLSVTVGYNKPLKIAARFDDGTFAMVGVEGDSTVVSSAPGILEVVSIPQCCDVIARAPGLAKLTATYENLTIEATISVQPSGPGDTPARQRRCQRLCLREANRPRSASGSSFRQAYTTQPMWI